MRDPRATHLTSREKWYEDEKDAAFDAWLLRDGPGPDEEEEQRYVLSRKWDRRFEIVTWAVVAVAGLYLLVAAVGR